jgi:hypothetical protein
MSIDGFGDVRGVSSSLACKAGGWEGGGGGVEGTGLRAVGCEG